MKNLKLIIVLSPVLLLMFLVEINYSQVSRSKGFGIRVGYWDGISATEANLGDVIAATPAGELYFFSRLKGNWFLEASLGGVSKSEVRGLQAKVESSNLTPLLLGARYDLLSA